MKPWCCKVCDKKINKTTLEKIQSCLSKKRYNLHVSKTSILILRDLIKRTSMILNTLHWGSTMAMDCSSEVESRFSDS